MSIADVSWQAQSALLLSSLSEQANLRSVKNQEYAVLSAKEEYLEGEQGLLPTV